MQSTKRAIITSAMALIICFAMLLGSTFAWFTDSVKSANNIIQTGTLDALLEYKTNWSDEWAPVTENTKVFKDGTLYEPGYTEVVYLRVSNAGSLAFKYSLSVNVAQNEGSVNANGEDFKLTDYLQIGTYLQDEYVSGLNNANILMPTLFGTASSAKQNAPLKGFTQENLFLCKDAPMLPGAQTSQVAAIVLSMPESVGNEANAKEGAAAPYIALGVRLFATQYTHEYDSFDNTYDENATANTINSLESLREAARRGGEWYLIDNVVFTNQDIPVAVEKDFVLNLNGYDIDASKQTSRPFELANDVDFTINGAINNDTTTNIENQEAVQVGAFGLINIPAGNNATVTLNGGKYVGATNDGSFIKPRGTGKISITLNNVCTVDKSTNGSCVVITNGYTGTEFTLNINGGYYEAPLPFDVPCINVKNATIVSTSNVNNRPAIGIQHPSKAASAGALIESCKIIANTVAISVGHASTVTVKKSEIIAPSTGYALLILGTGGTINAEEITYTGQCGTTGGVSAPARIYIDGVLKYEKNPK